MSFAPDTPGPGWNAPAFSPWLWASLERASQASFGSPARTYGEGGSIPFMGMLGERFPEAQFVITGVLGPDSNAHGPDEYLHLPDRRAPDRLPGRHPRRPRPPHLGAPSLQAAALRELTPKPWHFTARNSVTQR